MESDDSDSSSPDISHLLGDLEIGEEELAAAQSAKFDEPFADLDTIDETDNAPPAEALRPLGPADEAAPPELIAITEAAGDTTPPTDPSVNTTKAEPKPVTTQEDSEVTEADWKHFVMEIDGPYAVELRPREKAEIERMLAGLDALAAEVAAEDAADQDDRINDDAVAKAGDTTPGVAAPIEAKPIGAALADLNRIVEPEGAAAADAAVQRSREAKVSEAETTSEPGVLEAGGPVTSTGESHCSTGELQDQNAAAAIADNPMSDDDPGPVTSHPEAYAIIDARTAEPSTEATVDRLLDDLEIEPGEVKEPITTTEAAPDPEALSKLMGIARAKRAELNGGIDVAIDDPLATEKVKVGRKLKTVGLTLDDLPPDFWSLPPTTRIPLKRSRQSEFWRVYKEAQAKIEETARRLELEESGRPANFDRLPRTERDRINNKLSQQRTRAKKRAGEPRPPAAPPLPVADVASADLEAVLKEMLRLLANWSEHSTTPRARQLRERKDQLGLIKVAAAYGRYFHQNNKPPSRAELAGWLRLSERQVRRKLDVLKSLYAPGGPWASK